MNIDRYEFIKNRLITIAELSREACVELPEFVDSIPMHELAATSRDVYALAVGVRDFRLASTGALAALLAGRRARGIR